MKSLVRNFGHCQKIGQLKELAGLLTEIILSKLELILKEFLGCDRLRFMLNRTLTCILVVGFAVAAQADKFALPKGSRFILQTRDGSVTGIDKSYYGFALKEPTIQSPQSVVPLAFAIKTFGREYATYLQGLDGSSLMVTSRFVQNRTRFYLETTPQPQQLLDVPGPAELFDVGSHEKLVAWILPDGRPQLVRLRSGGVARDFQYRLDPVDIARWYNPKVYGATQKMEATLDGILVATDRYLLRYRFVAGTKTAVVENQYDLSPLKRFFYLSDLRIDGLWTNGHRGWISVSVGGPASRIVPFELLKNNLIVFYPGRQLTNTTYLQVVDVEASGDLVYSDLTSPTQFSRGVYILGFEQPRKSLVAHLEFSDLNGTFKLQAWINRILYMERSALVKMDGLKIRAIGSRNFDHDATERFPYDFSGEVDLDYPRQKFYPEGRSSGRSIMDIASEDGLYRLQVLTNEIDELPDDARLTLDQFVAEFYNRLEKFRKKGEAKELPRYFEIVSNNQKEKEQNALLAAPWEDYLFSLRVDLREFIAVVNTSPRLKAAIMKAHPHYLRAWNITTQPQISLIKSDDAIVDVAEFAKIASDATCDDTLRLARLSAYQMRKVLEFPSRLQK